MKQAKPTLSSSERDPFVRTIAWFGTLPRAAKWGVLAGALFGGFMLLDKAIWPIADRMSERSDRWELLLARASERADGLPPEIAANAVAYGPNEVPEDEARGMRKLAASVDSILRKKGVTKYSQDIRRGQQLGTDVLGDIAGPLGGTMGRTIADIAFEAAPDDVTGIIADLDGSADIDAIADLKLTYAPATKRVAVQMSVEKWGVLKRTPKRGGA
ncbi:MAG: hypothetical protein ACKO3W_04320 [bacterium]